MTSKMLLNFAIINLLYITNSCFASEVNISAPIIRLKQGLLRGKVEISFEGVPYYSFSGIPYAQPPVGKLRFKDPVPGYSWEGVRDGTVESDLAAQFDMFTFEYSGVDDCLYLNVYTPRLKKGVDLLPVVVKLFGGGMVNGNCTAKHFKPDSFIEENLVFIHVNFRVGVMAFLCTDPINARGDMGLKDQTMALKWVKDNIEVFNGDPNKVTLMGCSSGSATVDYHVISPMSKGLFHRAIMQSGSVMNFWARSRNAVKYAERLALILGYNKFVNETLFDFLNKFDTRSLVLGSSKCINKDDLKLLRLSGFPPVINTFKEYNGFINEEPHILLKKGEYNKVEIMSGFNSYEGLVLSYHHYLNCGVYEDLLNGDMKAYIPSFLNVEFDGLDNAIDTLYGSKPENYMQRKYTVPTNIVDFIGDLTIYSGVLYSLEQRLKHNFTNEYFYYYYHNLYSDGSNKLGADHAAEEYLLGITNDPTKWKPENFLVRSYLKRLWGNFIRTGNPTPEKTDLIDFKWSPMTEEKFQFLKLGINLNMSTVLMPERRALWKKLYEKIKIQNNIN